MRTIIVVAAVCAAPAFAAGQRAPRPLWQRIKLEQGYRAAAARADLVTAVEDLKQVRSQLYAVPADRPRSAEIRERLNDYLRQLPRMVTGGVQFRARTVTHSGFLGNRKLALEPSARELYDATEPLVTAAVQRLERSRDRLARIERGHIARLDRAFMADRTRFLAALEQVPVELLHRTAVSLIEDLGTMVTSSDLHKEPTLRGEERSSHESSSTGRILGGVLGKTEHRVATESSRSWRGGTLVVEASTYGIVLKTARSAPLDHEPAQLNAVQTRLILERALQAADIIRALERRAPALASGLRRWRAASRIEISAPERVEGLDVERRSVVLRMGRLQADLVALGDAPFLSSDFRQALRFEVENRSNQLAGSTPLLE